MKNCIITGGTSGFGRHLSTVFCKYYNVYIISKSKKKYEYLKKKIKTKNKIYFIKCDLSNIKESNKVAKKITKIKNLKIIVFNAGTIESDNSKTPKIYKTNYLSNFLIINYLIKKFHKQKGKLILINISSTTHKFSDFKNNLFSNSSLSFIKYANSKLMMLLLFFKIQKDFNEKFLTMSFDPGWMKTNFGNNQKNILRKFLNFFRGIFAKGNSFQKNQAKKLAEITLKKSNYYCGKYFDFLGIKKPSTKVHNISLRNHLWKKTISLLAKNQIYF